MKQVAWLGLGLIGLPMASRLAAAGWRVTGFDVNPERLKLASQRRIETAASIAAALDGAQFIFTSMPNERVFVEVLSALPTRTTVIDTSTVGPQASAKVAAALEGVAYLRAPISGSVGHAESGQLTTFVSGPRAAFDAAADAFKAYTRAQFWVGEGEEARYAKLAVNLMVAVTAGMMKEALALGTKGGISWEKMLELIGESVVASPVVKYKQDPVRRHDYTPTATTSLVLKDVDLMVATAKAEGIELPLASVMQALFRRAAEQGLAERDFFSVVEAEK
ncbi:MAG TPA: NAD(P)-dependent oxidoreductase [Burkholderiales bacterium]|nr:NAD(P)-dependent oxidoreductase [Burkholderiales bacterium]